MVNSPIKIPYLNGGLFRPDPIEPELQFDFHHSDWKTIFEFLNEYHWIIVEDVEAAIDHLMASDDVDPTQIAFIGYSWGTYVGLPVTHKSPNIKLIVGISCPVGLWNYNYLRECDKPKLLIVGNYDSFAPKEKIQHLFDRLSSVSPYVLPFRQAARQAISNWPDDF